MNDEQEGLPELPVPPGGPPLPTAAAVLLTELAAPPRLVRHLALVHAAAVTLVAALLDRWSALPLDRTAVALGAALHDVGKAAHPEEITGPGGAHGPAGEALLLERGWSATVARIARTHQTWPAEGEALPLEDLVVALADAVWRGARPEALEMLLARRIAALTGEAPWVTYLALDEVAAALAAGAEARLTWAASGLVGTSDVPVPQGR